MIGIGATLKPADHPLGEHRHRCQIDGAHKSQPGENVIDIFGGALTGSDAGDVAAKFSHVVGDVIGD